jgi:hypothetical protein
MKPSWSIFDCRQLISFRLPLTHLMKTARLIMDNRSYPSVRSSTSTGVLVTQNFDSPDGKGAVKGFKGVSPQSTRDRFSNIIFRRGMICGSYRALPKPLGMIQVL